MLILTRRIGESFIIGDEVKITVLKNTGNQVRIGIEAPKSIAVHRKEILHKIQENKPKLSKVKTNEVKINNTEEPAAAE